MAKKKRNWIIVGKAADSPGRLIFFSLFMAAFGMAFVFRSMAAEPMPPVMPGAGIDTAQLGMVGLAVATLLIVVMAYKIITQPKG
jgi:hypothetical protein